MIEITDKALQTAAAKGMDEFLRVFTDKYKETVGGDPTAETMPLLSTRCSPTGFSGTR